MARLSDQLTSAIRFLDAADTYAFVLHPTSQLDMQPQVEPEEVKFHVRVHQLVRWRRVVLLLARRLFWLREVKDIGMEGRRAESSARVCCQRGP